MRSSPVRRIRMLAIVSLMTSLIIFWRHFSKAVARADREPTFTRQDTNVREITLTGVDKPHSLVSPSAQVISEVYAYINLPIVLKREDTYLWLPVNSGELKIQKILRSLLGSVPLHFKYDETANMPGGRGIVINVGAHECFFCVISMLHGLRVYAVEPLPLCVSGIQETFSLYPQRLVKQVSLYNNYVSDSPIAIDTPANVCSGTFHINAESSDENKVVSSIRLDEIPLDGGDIEILAIDTEGNELSVLASAMSIFRTKAVKNVFFEYTAIWYRERTRFNLDSAIELMEEIIRLQGYKCYLLLDFVDSISSMEELDIRTQFSQDWNAETAESQTDIYCTRCTHWLKVNHMENISITQQVAELCDEYS